MKKTSLTSLTRLAWAALGAGLLATASLNGATAQAAGPTVTVAPSAPTPTSTVTATISPADAGASYLWLRDHQPITGATKASYAVTMADLCTQLSVRVTTAAGTTESATVVPRFADVPGNHTFSSSICWAARAGITAGAGDGSVFLPANPVNRGAMSAFIWRAVGSPAWTAPATSPFVDVPTSHPFYKTITWLESTGITKGVVVNGQLYYQPSSAVNRGSMAQFLYRAAGSPAYTAPTTSPFIDLPTSHTFYKAINWMYDRGITQGVATGGALGYFAANPVNRGAMTAFLKRVQPLLQPGEPQQPPPPPVLPASPCQITLNPGKYQPFCPEDPAVKSWRFIVAEDEAMTKVIQTVVVNKPSTTISNLMEYQSVYQQVQLCTAKEGAGTCTTAWRPQRIDVPGKDWASVDWAQLTQVTPDRVTVQWQPAAGATAYTVEVYSASDRTKVGAFSVKASAACPAKGEEDTPTSLTLNRAQLTGLGAERSFLINVTSSRCASQSKNGTHYPALFQAGFPYAAPGGTAFALTVQSFNALQQSSANQDYDAVAPNPALLHNWSQRVVKLAEQIRSADLVAVQETKWYPEDPGATRGHIQDLAAAAGLTLAMRPDGQGPCNDSSEHFLYNPAKLALTRCGVEAITPDAPRHVAWAEFQDRASGKSVFAANTHTTMDTPDGGPQTVTTIERVLAIVEANNTADRPVILLGDFNADLGQSTSPLGLIARAGYVDTAWVATARSYPNQWLPSRHGFAPVDQTTYHTSVDHIFTNQSIVVNTHQVGYLSPAQAVTDHFSLTAEVSVYS